MNETFSLLAILLAWLVFGACSGAAFAPIQAHPDRWNRRQMTRAAMALFILSFACWLTAGAT